MKTITQLQADMNARLESIGCKMVHHYTSTERGGRKVAGLHTTLSFSPDCKPCIVSARDIIEHYYAPVVRVSRPSLTNWLGEGVLKQISFYHE